ncbi:MAG: RNA methyltransferase [Candidatus Promineifilaceae bacterium]
MITSTSNPLIKRVRRLKQKKYRQKDGAFFVEGLRVFFSAVEAQAPIQTILYSPELLTSELALKVLADRRKAGFEPVETTAQVFRSISTREHPVGLGAVVSTAWIPIEQLPTSQKGLYVSLLNVSEPGNLGTIIRTVDAVGADGLILAGQCVDPYHQTAVKASMGTLFHVPISEVGSVQDLLIWARDQGINTIATSARAPQSFWELNYKLPLMIMLGSEGEGLPADILDEADQSVSVPMKGSASSLNLAVAAGLILYEVMRQT